jgi:hypothetical protein
MISYKGWGGWRLSGYVRFLPCAVILVSAPLAQRRVRPVHGCFLVWVLTRSVDVIANAGSPEMSANDASVHACFG